MIADPVEWKLETMLVNISAEFRAKKHHPNWMGIQFVQIGNDDGARAALDGLTKLDTGVRISFHVVVALVNQGVCLGYGRHGTVRRAWEPHGGEDGAHPVGRASSQPSHAGEHALRSEAW